MTGLHSAVSASIVGDLLRTGDDDDDEEEAATAPVSRRRRILSLGEQGEGRGCSTAHSSERSRVVVIGDEEEARLQYRRRLRDEPGAEMWGDLGRYGEIWSPSPAARRARRGSGLPLSPARICSSRREERSG